ncbi:MAG: FG-GAP-like repeat-containing protein, partial [candidate division Zixibacteria bacterium]|nr:FG-GAP-like repeat-containing protein [candidate division Zixibacteria bacterium]
MFKTNIFPKLFFASLILFWALPLLAQNPDSIPFAPAVSYLAADLPLSVFCADLDGDGDLDLAVTGGSPGVSILKNNGNGTFGFPIFYQVGNDPRFTFCADLDGDGDLDLAVANGQSNFISILENNGDGTFQAKVDYVT